MTDIIHPARLMPFEDLAAGLKRAAAAGLVYRRWADGLSLYVYTPRCVYEDASDEFTLLARGLILDEAARVVVATPFSKFFNVGERHGAVPDLPFEAFEKLDGSLITCFWHEGKWRAATKGVFASAAGDDLAAIRRDLPEEFWGDFDDIIRLLSAKVAHLEARVAQVAAEVAPLSDKELGFVLNTLPADAWPYLFSYRKSGAITGKARDSLMREVRPTGNVLEGYVPSYVMGRVLEEAIS